MGAAAMGTSAAGSLMGAGALAIGGVLLILLAHRLPRTATTAAIVVLCLVPVWIGLGIGFNGNLFIPASSLVTLAVAAALLPLADFEVSPADLLLLLLLLLAATSLITSDARLAVAFLVTPFLSFVAGYVFGRISTARVGAEVVYRAIAVVFTAVAILAIIEFVTGFNPFVTIAASNSSFAEWGDIQERGGLSRAEGAFGHSIALASSLALAIPLTLASTFSFWLRTAMVAVMVVGTTLTFSRIGIISALLGLILCIVFFRKHLRRGQRIVLAVVGTLVTGILAPLVITVFEQAGTEAANSAGYRGDLLQLLAYANLVGFTPEVNRTGAGQLAFGSFRSIDSQLLLTALTNGLIALAAVVIAFIVAIVLCLRGKATPATIAVVAQIPAMTSVALITQYSTFIWVVIGVAATTQIVTRTRRDPFAPSFPPSLSTTGDRHDRNTAHPARNAIR